MVGLKIIGWGVVGLGVLSFLFSPNGLGGLLTGLLCGGVLLLLARIFGQLLDGQASLHYRLNALEKKLDECKALTDKAGGEADNVVTACNHDFLKELTKG